MKDSEALQQLTRMLARGLRYAQWIIFLLLVVIGILFFKFRLSKQIDRDVIRTEAKADVTQQTLLNFVDQTLRRWEQFKTDNPDVKVPKLEPPSSEAPGPRHD